MTVSIIFLFKVAKFNIKQHARNEQLKACFLTINLRCGPCISPPVYKPPHV